MPSSAALLKRGGIAFPKLPFWQRWSSTIIGAAKPIGGVQLRRLPRSTALGIAVFWGCSLVLTFSLLLWNSATVAYNQAFLSLDKNIPGGICEEVPLPASGTFQASIDGFWETDKSFNFNRSAFVLTLSGAELTNVQFQSGILDFAKRLAVLGEQFKGKNLLLNLLVWATFSFKRGSMLLSSTADPAIIFDMQISQAFVASINGSCKFTPRFPARFDRTSKRIEMTFPVPSLNGTSLRQPCPGQGAWVTGNSGGLSPILSQFSVGSALFSFDIRSTMVALSVNLGIAQLESFQQVRSPMADSYGLVGYVDGQFTPAMDPVYCLDKDKVLDIYGIRLSQRQLNGPPVCFLVDSFRSRNLRFFYPWMNQLFYDKNRPLYPGGFSQRFSQQSCTCPICARDPVCNFVERYFVAYFYDVAFNATETVSLALRMLDVYATEGSFAIIERLSGIIAYNEQVVGVRGNPSGGERGIQRPVVSFVDNSTGKFFDLSAAGGLNIEQLANREFARNCPTCGVIVFHLVRLLGRTDISFPLNKYGLQLSHLVRRNPADVFSIKDDPDNVFSLSAVQLNRMSRMNMSFNYIMCRDTLSQPEAFERLARTPPIELINSYYACRKTVRSAILSSVGSSSAAANLYMFIAWVLLGMLFREIYTAFHRGQVYPSEHRLERVSDAERDVEREALREVVESLRGVADELESRGSNRAAVLMRAKVGAFSQLFQGKGESHVHEMGRRITERLAAQESAASVVEQDTPAPATPHAGRRLTITLPSSVRGNDERRTTLNARPLNVVLSSMSPPGRLSASLGAAKRASMAGYKL